MTKNGCKNTSKKLAHETYDDPGESTRNDDGFKSKKSIRTLNCFNNSQ